MANKHTPGPWIVLGEGTEIWTDGENRASHFLAETVGSKSMAIALQGLANARLIAAAPDLLASLEECVAHLHCPAHFKPGGDRACETCARYERARVALAKARDE